MQSLRCDRACHLSSLHLRAKPVTLESVVLSGEGRIIGVGTSPTPCRITLDDGGFEIDVQGAKPLIAAYRDLATLTVQPGSTLLVLGEGADAVRVVVERMGDRLATLVRELRERRARQRLGDALVEPQADPFELVEYGTGAEHAVAQIAFQPWGAELVPVDERLAWRRVRRGAIRGVTADGASGTVRVELAPEARDRARPAARPCPCTASATPPPAGRTGS